MAWPAPRWCITEYGAYMEWYWQRKVRRLESATFSTTSPKHLNFHSSTFEEIVNIEKLNTDLTQYYFSSAFLQKKISITFRVPHFFLS
jgi:cytoplasmic iron level regulating protein YaaA (DUF328/UPF0246 family)